MGSWPFRTFTVPYGTLGSVGTRGGSVLALFSERGAWFSPCRTYRYALWRRWDINSPLMVFIMLNPSTADEVENDPTIARCERRAFDGGAGGLMVANLFAYRSTDPRVLSAVADPIGPENDAAIAHLCENAQVVICAWGSDKFSGQRGATVIARLRDRGITPLCLGLNKDSAPKHPLYVRVNAPLIEVPPCP